MARAFRSEIEEPEERLRSMRIYTLARELRLSNAEILDMARAHGANVSTPSSTIAEGIVAAIREQHAKREPSKAQAPQKTESHRKPTLAPDNKDPAPPPAPAPPARQSHSRQRSPQQDPSAQKKKIAESTTDVEAEPAQLQDQSKSRKRYYLVDGLNVCNWPKTASLAPLLTLLIELKRQGYPFLCIFDANTRFVLEDLGERDKYELLLNKYDCFGEVPGGTQADDFLLFRAHKTGDAIVTNDQYRDQKYRERYKWLRSVSPRLCKGMVLGGFLILPELDVHARIRESLSGVMKDFEDAFGTGSGREHQPDPRQAHGAHRRRAPAQPKVSATVNAPAPKEPPQAPPQAPPPAEPAASTETTPSEASATPAGEQRPRSRRRRRRGRRGGGGGAQGNNGNAQAGENGPPTA
jgi:hypothetical protein